MKTETEPTVRLGVWNVGEPTHESILPIDIGFDPRMHKMPIALSRETTSVTYDSDGEEFTVVGSIDQIVRVLNAAKYLVVLD